MRTHFKSAGMGDRRCLIEIVGWLDCFVKLLCLPKQWHADQIYRLGKIPSVNIPPNLEQPCSGQTSLSNTND